MDNSQVLNQILGLQQDSSTAAIGPHNWDEPPFPGLIETSQTRQIEKAAAHLIEGSDTGIWHFLVGSPGNGKSALIGLLVRTLRAANWVEMEKEHVGKTLPYVQYLAKKGEKWPSVLIVQDASVSRSPHDPENTLASQLEDVIEEAYGKGLSLFVCANRGVLEQLPDLESIKTKAWYRQINSVCIRGDSESSQIPTNTQRKRVHDSVVVTCEQIDQCSITNGMDSPLANLLNKLIENSRWSNCENCGVSRLCPFKSNRDLLSQPLLKERLFSILNDLELYRGQSIVFREGGALLSMMLAGSFGDYKSGTPCDWVKEMAVSENYEALLSRKLYMVLFGGNSIAGFDQDPNVREKQIEILTDTVDSEIAVFRAWESLLNNPPRAQYGCEDARKALTELDPLIEKQGDEELDLVSFDSPELVDFLRDGDGLFELELAAIDAWSNISNELQNPSKPKFYPLEAHALVHRFSSAFLVRLAGFLDRWNIQLRFSRELEEFKGLIDTVGSTQTSEVIRKIDQYSKLVNDCIEQISGRTARRSKLMESLEAENEFLSKVARIGITKDYPGSSQSIGLRFGRSEVSTELTAKLYCWMRKTRPEGTGSLLPEFIPKQLLAGARVARRQAISRSNYLEKVDVELFTPIESESGNVKSELKLYRSATSDVPLVEKIS